MEEFKGTKGFWATQDDEESMATSVVMSEFGGILCVVGTYMTSTEEDYANADLIAAAPELLEALQLSVSVIKNMAEPSQSKTFALEMATAAIKKALGK